MNDDESKVVDRLTQIVTDNARMNHGKLLGGPYHPQENSLLFLLEFETLDAFQKSGKATLDRIAREGIAVTPMRYDVAFACGEFGGP